MRKRNLAYKLGNKIRILRKAVGLTQAALAEAADISINFMGCIERGERTPSIETIDKLAKALNISPKEFFEFPDAEDEAVVSETFLAEIRKCKVEDIKILTPLVRRLAEK